MLVGFLSFLWFLCALAFPVLLTLLIIWLVRKKSWKPFVISTLIVLAGVIFLPAAIVVLYVPAEKPESVVADSELTDDEQQEISTEGTITADTTIITTTTTEAATVATESTDDEPLPRENPLYAADIKIGDVMSGIGNNKLGEYVWIEMPKVTMLSLSQEEMLSYSKDVISPKYGSFNWFTIAMDDGTGLICHGCFYPTFSYGILDDDGTLLKTLGDVFLTDESIGYEYFPREEDELSEDTTTQDSSPAPSEVEPDLDFIRSFFDTLIFEYEGAIVSIEPRTIDGEVFSWSIIDVVVPDAWYYLEEYQKNRYCQNVGDYIKAAVIAGGVAESELGVSVYFYDIAGFEVAKSKMFGGYKLT